MTADEFREIALSFPGAEERSHMNHPDFRVGGKIFATLNEDLSKGMVNLDADRQQEYMLLDPSFHPASGAWGRKGSSMITLATAQTDVVRSALATAWQLRSTKK
ncbi:MAG TPA: MmcQ/YjbR family DNA-binding protein [Pyrinomonadaceae bacterium]|nr:MmcQ/YjbR family DNA-binding protein [Pyrinomonadaceae bacterium]